MGGGAAGGVLAGRISAAGALGCPPAVPVVLCGQRMDTAAVEVLHYWLSPVRRADGIREKGSPAASCAVGLHLYASRSVSRVLYLSSHLSRRIVARALKPPPGSGRADLLLPIAVLLRIEFTASDCLQPMGELLPRLSTLTGAYRPQRRSPAVYLCCTFPEVAFGGRYPLSLPCGARTFLINGLSACPTRLSGLLAGSYCTGWRRKSQPEMGKCSGWGY